MKLNFEYEKEKDIWCILNKGKDSKHSQKPTSQYEKLIEKYGDNPNNKDVSDFIGSYIQEKNVSIEEYLDYYQKDWDSFSDAFHQRAQEIFGAPLPKNITAYLTINSRCPYSIEEDYFFVTFPTYDYIARKTAMHELWHFYTWYGLGTDQVQILGEEKYGNLKEALTVLINVICKDVLPEGVADAGYSQHKELREKILDYWSKNPNIKDLWEYLKIQ